MCLGLRSSAVGGLTADQFDLDLNMKNEIKSSNSQPGNLKSINMNLDYTATLNPALSVPSTAMHRTAANVDAVAEEAFMDRFG